MSDDLLIVVAKEEGWNPATACSARDAAEWLRANGKTVIEAENAELSHAPTRVAERNDEEKR